MRELGLLLIGWIRCDYLLACQSNDIPKKKCNVRSTVANSDNINA